MLYKEGREWELMERERERKRDIIWASISNLSEIELAITRALDQTGSMFKIN